MPEKASTSGHYLAPSGLDLDGVPPPPAPGSLSDKADLKEVFDWQKKRTKDDCSRAYAEISHDFKAFFGEISPFPKPLPDEVSKFFKHVGKDSVAAHRYLKSVYKRPRPFLRDKKLSPCIPRIRGFSYPSGHSTMARLFALILGDLVPSRRGEFMARADEAALLRVISGVHHPSDIEAGKALAGIVYRYLLENDDFVSDMKELRGFLRARPALRASTISRRDADVGLFPSNPPQYSSGVSPALSRTAASRFFE